MAITLQLQPDVANALHENRADQPLASELTGLASELGVTLRPMHPGVDDASLRTFFLVEAVPAEQAETLAARLRRARAVQSAYIKPADELP